MKRIPKTGEKLKFWDDGKVGHSRRYVAKVNGVFAPDDVKRIFVIRGDDEMSVYDIWLEQADECDWVYAKETDVFVRCFIPGYDDNDIWFVRTKQGGWFSIDCQSGWQSGYLDVDDDYYDDTDDTWFPTWKEGVNEWAERMIKKGEDSEGWKNTIIHLKERFINDN